MGRLRISFLRSVTVLRLGLALVGFASTFPQLASSVQPQASYVQGSDKLADLGKLTLVEEATVAESTFLIVSSPSAKKLTWTQVLDVNKALDNRVYPLVDGGLNSPKGIAYCKQSGSVYVADPGKNEIFKYSIFVEVDRRLRKELKVDGDKVVIVKNVDADWVTVDSDGNLIFSDRGKGTINKIKRSVLLQLEQGSLTADDLSEAPTTSVSSPASASSAPVPSSALLPGSAPPALESPKVIELAAGLSTVNEPGSVESTGDQVYWTATGATPTTPGDVYSMSGVQLLGLGYKGGSSHKKVLGSTNVKGICATNKMLFLAAGTNMLEIPLHSGTGLGVGNSTGSVSGPTVSASSPTGMKTVLSGLAIPNGCAWDGDGTIYVADSGAGEVYAFPSHAKSVQNGERTVSLVGAFDVAVVKASDPGLIVRDKRNGDSGASLRIGNLHLTVFLAVITFGLVTMLA